MKTIKLYKIYTYRKIFSYIRIFVGLVKLDPRNNRNELFVILKLGTLPTQVKKILYKTSVYFACHDNVKN